MDSIDRKSVKLNGNLPALPGFRLANLPHLKQEDGKAAT